MGGYHDEGDDPTSAEIMQAARDLVASSPALAMALARCAVGNFAACVAAKCQISPKDRMITNVRLMFEGQHIDRDFKRRLDTVRNIGNKAYYAPGVPFLTEEDAVEYLPLAEQALRDLGKV